jgi:hypothetical protein
LVVGLFLRTEPGPWTDVKPTTDDQRPRTNDQ